MYCDYDDYFEYIKGDAGIVAVIFAGFVSLKSA
jgi:hypothetical protein